MDKNPESRHKNHNTMDRKYPDLAEHAEWKSGRKEVQTTTQGNQSALEKKVNDISSQLQELIGKWNQFIFTLDKEDPIFEKKDFLIEERIDKDANTK